MPFEVIDTQPTPNPNALKFSLDKPVAEDKPLSFLTAAEARANPVATALFTIPGVVGVMLLHDFVTLSKADNATWKKIIPTVRKTMADLKDPEAPADDRSRPRDN